MKVDPLLVEMNWWICYVSFDVVYLLVCVFIAVLLLVLRVFFIDSLVRGLVLERLHFFSRFIRLSYIFFFIFKFFFSFYLCLYVFKGVLVLPMHDIFL